MSAPPPRRRRRPEPAFRSIPFPLLALLVVIAGFAIGAIFSYARNRAGSSTNQTTVVVVTPSPAATAAPPSAARATTPSATPPPTPSATPTPRRIAVVHSPPRTTSPRPTAMPQPPPTTAPPSPVPTATATPQRTATPVPPPATPRPAPAETTAPRTPRPALSPRTAPPTAPSAGPAISVTGTDPAFGRQAVGIVRTYLNAVMRGDETTAFAQLGGTRGDRNLSLDEEAILTPGAHVTSYHAQAHGEATATVEAEIVSPKGTYYATYQVANGPGGMIITSHEYIQP